MSETYKPAPPPTRRFPLPLLLVWAAMTGVALTFVSVFGFNVPYADEWDFVPALVGRTPVVPWLWQQHNEHRLPLTRAVYYGLFQLTHDFRTGMYVQVAFLSALAFSLMRLAARLRGRTDWVDLFFPISLLHLGHWENFVMGYQIFYIFFCVLATALGVVAFRTRRETAFKSGVEGGVLLMLIALSGGVGLSMIPAIIPWLVYLAVLVWRSGRRAQSLLVLVLAAAPVGYLALYFQDYHRPSHHPPLCWDKPLAVGMVTAEVLALAFGMGVAGVWWAVAAGEAGAGIVTLRRLVQQGRDPETRPAAAGLAAVFAGLFGLALAIGLGRASFDSTWGLWSRYSLLAWPLAGLTFLAWVEAGRRGIPMLFCVVAALAFIPNMITGMMNGAAVYQMNSRIEDEARAELPAQQIVADVFPDSYDAGQADRAIRYIPLLRAAKIGAFTKPVPGDASPGSD